MKKTIAMILALVLITCGLGAVTYAQTPSDSTNDVLATLMTNWHYEVPQDTYRNHSVRGEKDWQTQLTNRLDTSDPMNNVMLTLTPADGVTFDYMWPEDNLNIEEGILTWDFDTVNQGSRVGARVGTGYGSFIPGFDASRLIADGKTVFLQSDGTQTQTVDITVKSQTEQASVFIIHVDAGAHSLVDTVVDSYSTSEGYDIHPYQDDRYVHLQVMDIEFGDTFTASVQIEVTPNIPEVEYMPGVVITRIQMWPLDGVSGSGVELTTEIGTWNWSAVGSYQWSVHQGGGPASYELTWGPLFPGGKDVATQRNIHLYAEVSLVNGSVDPNGFCSITGNIFTLSHVLAGNDWQGDPCTYGALDSGCVGGWSSENSATPTKSGRISGSFYMDKNPAPLGWDTGNYIYVSFDGSSHYVPPYGPDDMDHYNFSGSFRITGGTGFYEGIQGSGTISGTFHDHEWGSSIQGEETWFDFVMIGDAFFR